MTSELKILVWIKCNLSTQSKDKLILCRPTYLRLFWRLGLFLKNVSLTAQTSMICFLSSLLQNLLLLNCTEQMTWILKAFKIHQMSIAHWSVALCMSRREFWHTLFFFFLSKFTRFTYVSVKMTLHVNTPVFHRWWAAPLIWMFFTFAFYSIATNTLCMEQ